VTDLRADLRQSADHLNQLTAEVMATCEANGVPPFKAIAPDGSPLLAPLLAAHGQVLAALANLGAPE
jgi:hypothetical protein